MFAIPLAVMMAMTPAPLSLAALEPAPTGVTLAWTSPAHDDVVVTWDETGDFRNRVDLVFANGSPTGWAPRIVEAGQPNRSPLPGKPRGLDMKILVSVAGADDSPISDRVPSPVFDTDPRPQPALTVTPHVDGTVGMRWAKGPLKDDNPGDPLDYDDAGPPVFLPVATVAGFNMTESLAEASTATTFTVPADRKYPTWVGVQTEANFWGVSGTFAEVTTLKLTASVPHSARAGDRLKVTGQAIRAHRACDPGPCFPIDRPDEGRVLTLQARTGADAVWAKVATTRATSSGAFTFSVRFPGTRDYRVIAAPAAYPARSIAGLYAETPPATTRAAPSAPSPAPPPAGGPSLPITGTPTVRIVGAGGLLVLFGVVLLGAARRRSRA